MGRHRAGRESSRAKTTRAPVPAGRRRSGVRGRGRPPARVHNTRSRQRRGARGRRPQSPRATRQPRARSDPRCSDRRGRPSRVPSEGPRARRLDGGFAVPMSRSPCRLAARPQEITPIGSRGGDFRRHGRLPDPGGADHHRDDGTLSDAQTGAPARLGLPARASAARGHHGPAASRVPARRGARASRPHRAVGRP